MRLGVRIASGVVMVAALVVALWLGGVVLDVVLGLVAAVGLYEYAGLMRGVDADPPPWVLYPLAGWLLYRFLLPSSVPALELGLGGAVVVGLLSALVLRERPVLRWSTAVGGALYLGLSLGYYLALLRWHGGDQERFGLRIIGVVVASAIAGDTAALFAGRAFGRHRFFPLISPHKTVEGAIGGAVACVAVVVIGAPWLFGLDRLEAVGLGVALAIASQGGDLVESALKRAAAAKDASNLIPGHGGVLDRLDSLVLLGPVVYCFLRVVSLS